MYTSIPDATRAISDKQIAILHSDWYNSWQSLP